MTDTRTSTSQQAGNGGAAMATTGGTGASGATGRPRAAAGGSAAPGGVGAGAAVRAHGGDGGSASRAGAGGTTVLEDRAGGGSTVLIRYFAGARAAAGVTEERIELAPRGSVADALAVAARRGPALVRVLPSCSFLLNGIAVHDHEIPVPDGGEIDVLPPFAGG